MTPFTEKITTGQIVLAGCILALFYAIFSQGVYHPDEHYQILEFARMKLLGSPTPDHLPWEYPLMMRPGLQPWIAWAVGKGLLCLGVYSPWTHVFLLQFLSAILSVTVLLFFYRTVEEELGKLPWRKWFLTLGFFLWFITYLHVHFSAEMISGNLLLLLAALVMRYRKAFGKDEFKWGLAIGAAAGLTFAVRFQTGFALAGLGFWLLAYNRRWKLYAGMVPGILLMLGLGFLADHWLYGEWALTPVNYLRENILNSQMDKFGISPWYYYFTAAVLDGGVIFGLPVLIATLFFFFRNRRHVISWMLVPFIAAHFFMGHKELRFLFPVLFFAPYFLVLAMKALPERATTGRGWRWVVGVFAVVNGALLLYNLTQPTPDIHFFKAVRDYCKDKKEVVALNLSGSTSYYSMTQYFTDTRDVEARLYMPDNLDLMHPATPGAQDSLARALTAAGKQVLILSENPGLQQESSLPLRRIDWNPYPEWVLRRFDFKDCNGLSIQTKNIYEVLPESPTSR